MPFTAALAKAIQTGDINLIATLITEEKAWDTPNEEGIKPIHVAIDYGHLEVVDWLLKNGVSLECANLNGSTPLYRAAFKGQSKIIEHLLKVYQDKPNKKRPDGKTPLFGAAHQGHTESIALILEHGADIGQADNKGMCPLWAAAFNGHRETVALLLKHKADIGQVDNDGRSPLWAAAYNGHKDTVVLLLEHKADVGQVNNKGASPLYAAVFNGHKDTVVLLLEHKADVGQATTDGASPLLVAAQKGHTATVALLLEHKADIRQSDNDGVSPLFVAAQEGHTATVALLLEHKADIGQADNDGASPLLVAAQKGHTATVALLLEHKADTGQANNDGASPLLVAAQNGHKETVILLLEHKADIRQSDNDGVSPLFVAAQEGHTATVALLLEHKADTGQANNDGASPLYVAAFKGHKDTVALLLAHKANIGQAMKGGFSPLYVAAQEGHRDTVALLLEHKAVIGQATKYGASPLFVAAFNGHTATVALLLEHKADITQVDNDGRSPLWTAAYNGHKDTVALLLEHKADIGQAAKDGASPLYVAAQFGHSETVALFLRQGALQEQSTLTQQTPLWIAAHEGHDKVVQILLTNGALMTPDDKGDTPLHVAVKKGHIAVIKHLLSKNAAISALNAKKQTPLMLAASEHDAVIFTWLLAAWFQQTVLTSQEAEHKDSLEKKKAQEANFSEKDIHVYKIFSFMTKIQPKDWSTLSILPPAALTLTKATRQSFTLKISEKQWQLAVKLGEGAFAEVFRLALPLPIGSVALKRLKLYQIASWFKISEKQVRDNILQSEISQLEKVRHPHVIELLSIANLENPLLVMELCDTNLDKVSPQTPYAQWQVAWEVACGLAYLHSLGIVHRNIKPENILLKDGIAKIADLRLAQIDPMLLDKAEPEQLQKLIGDPEWASPEEKKASKAYSENKGSLTLAEIKKVSTAAADIYRYGRVLIRYSYGIQKENSFGKPILRPIIEACLQQDPKRRPTALQVLGALEKNIPHKHPVLAKLCQRLGIFAHYHQHQLAHFLTPWVSSEPEIDWLTYQEGIEVTGDDAPQPFSTLWDQFLVNPEKRMLDLRGSGGLGKTLLGYYQLKEQWQALRQWLINPEGMPPTLVLLLTPDYLQTTAFTLEERLAEVYQLTADECKTLKKYQVVFLYDCEDEWQAKPQLDLAEWPQAKTWIIGRPSRSAKDSVYLLPFNQVQIVNYLRNTLTWDQATTQDFITQLPLSAIKEALRNPFVLSMFRLLWPLPRWQDLTKEGIYHTYFTQFIEKQQSHWLSGPYHKIYAELITHLQQEHKTLAESYLRFAGEVSLQLFEAKRLEGKVMVDSPWSKMSEKVQHLAENAFEEKQQLLANNEKSHLSLQQYQAFALAHLNCFVLPPPIELGYYRFRHKSLFEYAWAYSALLPNRPLEEDEALLTTYAQIHHQESKESEEKLDFTLIAESKMNPHLAPKAGNLLTLYNWARLPLTYNYQGAHIENANLAYANLIQADFRNTHLNKCYFANACIEKAHFDQVPDITQKSNRPHPLLLGHRQAILFSALSPDGQLLATLDSQEVFIWHKQHRIRHFLTHIPTPTALAIDNSGALLIGDELGFVYFYAGAIRQRKLRAHFEPILSVEFISEDRCWVGSATQNSLYHRKHYSREESWRNDYPVTCSAFHALSGQQALGTKNGKVAMNSIKERVVKNLWSYSLHQGASTAVRFSLTDKLASGGEDGRVFVYKINSTHYSRTLYSTQPILNLQWSQDSQSLVAITSSGFKVLNVFGKEQANFRAAGIQAIYLKNNQEGILVERSGNLYGIALHQRALNITWIAAGEHFKGGITNQSINESSFTLQPINEEEKEEEKEKKLEKEPADNNQILLTPVLQQEGLFADKNQSTKKRRVKAIDNSSKKGRTICTLL